MKAFIKKILPTKLFSRLQEVRGGLDLFLAKICVKYRFTSSLFYFILNGQFHREHQSVLAGRIAYHESLVSIDKSSALLRRNTHRLEKGLIMEPRRASFAEAYILETVDIFSRCLAIESFCRNELIWAADVLNSYFAVVSDTTIIAKARDRFNQLPVAFIHSETSTSASSPYSSEQRAKSNISSETLFTLFKQRRSVRWFEEKAVDISLLEQAIDMAAQAPSACNRQPFEFYTTTEPTIASEISSIPMGTQGFSQNVQALIVIMGDLSAYPFERDRHVIYIDSGLVSMQLMLAFESLGLSSCPINWPDIEEYETKLAKRLELPNHKRPVMMMAIGYAKHSGGIPFSQKKSAEQLVKVIK